MGSNEAKKIYETIVKYNKQKFDTRLTITEKKIELEKKKGLFKKTYKVIETINIDDIRVTNDKAQVSNKNTEVVIETINKTLKVSCNNIVEAKKLTEEIIKVKTGENLLERTSNKVAKIGKAVAKTATTIGGAVASVGAVAVTINKNKKEIVKAAKALKDIIKK